MVVLRHFLEQDAGFICGNVYPDLTIDGATTMIREWNSGVHQGKYFEMFAVLSGDDIVGYASLLEHSHSTVSAGIEILRTEQNKGFGAQTLATLIDLAVSKGYRIMFDQVRSTATGRTRRLFSTSNRFNKFQFADATVSKKTRKLIVQTPVYH